MKERQNLLKLAAINLLLWSADMAAAIAGFYFGFGLSVQNWPALIGFMIFSRWLIYVTRGVLLLHQESKKS